MTHLSFQPNGAPFSAQFDDIYFDTESGYQQSQSVFIEGNKLKERWQAFAEKTVIPPARFIIGETGFGTGLNFLLALQCYLATKHNYPNAQLPKLIYISTEKYPLTREELQRSLDVLPELSELTVKLTAQYPEHVSSNVSLNFSDENVELHLLIGDSTEMFSKVDANEYIVDAWFLDGFSPAKNPEQWQLPLYEQLARLSQPQTSISTFTVAGKVRRELTQVGFRLNKIPGRGKKKEILCGLFQQNILDKHGYKKRPRPTKPQHVAVIGGGIASACAAYSLANKGVKVSLYCQHDDVAQGASSNAIGALYPLLHQQRDEISTFYQIAFDYARHTYDQLLDHGFAFEHNWCGLLEVSYKEALIKRQQQFEQLKAWPERLIHSVTAQQVNQLANYPINMGGLFIPKAGWICPPSLVKATFDAARAVGHVRIKTQTSITAITPLENKKWQLDTGSGSFTADAVIYCGGAEGARLNYIEQLPLTAVRGQVSSMPTTAALNKLSTVICHKGYLTPQNHDIHCIGATFDKNNESTKPSIEDDEFNVEMLHKCLPGLAPWTIDDVKSSKARLRCMTPDHLPMVGPMPDIGQHLATYAHLRKDKNWRYSEAAPTIENLYVMTGLGARGLVSAPLLAEILAADICGTPYPVDDDQLFNLSPNRFVIRDLIRRKI